MKEVWIRGKKTERSARVFGTLTDKKERNDEEKFRRKAKKHRVLGRSEDMGGGGVKKKRWVKEYGLDGDKTVSSKKRGEGEITTKKRERISNNSFPFAARGILGKDKKSEAAGKKRQPDERRA